jgi:hypothetical protein
MPKTSGKKENNILSLNAALNTHSLNPFKTGMPALDSIVEVPLGATAMAAAKGRTSKYRVIETRSSLINSISAES